MLPLRCWCGVIADQVLRTAGLGGTPMGCCWRCGLIISGGGSGTELHCSLDCKSVLTFCRKDLGISGHNSWSGGTGRGGFNIDYLWTMNSE